MRYEANFRIRIRPLLVLLAWMLPLTADAQEPLQLDLRSRQTEYVGPGRELPEPDLPDRVHLGYFGPQGDDDLWRAAEMAVLDANRQGGYRGRPFKLVPGWSTDPWGTGVTQVTRMTYQDHVWGIIGGPDGPSTHLAEQVVAKARLVLLSPGSTDKSVNLANVPWMFSCLPGDHLLAPPLVEHLVQTIAGQPFVVVSANDHDSRHFARELDRCFVHHKVVPKFQYVFDPQKADWQELLNKVMAASCSAVVVVADASVSASLVVRLRSEGYEGLLFGGPSFGRRAFRSKAGSAAAGVIFPSPVTRTTSDFASRFEQQYGYPPDYAATCSYDAVSLLIAAIRQAGLNRAKIGDAVRGLSPYPGCGGTIHWDPLGSNTRPATLAKYPISPQKRGGSPFLWESE